MCIVKKWLQITLVLTWLLQISQAAYLRCYNGSIDNYIVTPLSNPLALLPCINTEIPTVVYTFGYRGKVGGPATTGMLNAYIAKKKRNVLLLDWQNEAQTGILGVELSYALSATPSTIKLGKELGAALIHLIKAGVHLEDIHLIAHSLGAHLMGYAGRAMRKKDFLLERITGLDPAQPLFDGRLAIYNGLDRKCARFVDIIHTDPNGFGTSSSTGTVDIWPNYTGKSGTQPGCPVGNFKEFSPEQLCSHDRSWRYYAESLASPTAFLATGAANYNEWVANDGKSNHTIYLGDLTNTNAKGNFYLMTNSEPPYGRGVNGTTPNKDQTRR